MIRVLILHDEYVVKEIDVTEYDLTKPLARSVLNGEVFEGWIKAKKSQEEAHALEEKDRADDLRAGSTGDQTEAATLAPAAGRGADQVPQAAGEVLPPAQESAARPDQEAAPSPAPPSRPADPRLLREAHGLSDVERMLAVACAALKKISKMPVDNLSSSRLAEARTLADEALRRIDL
jgi:hypothetical protein